MSTLIALRPLGATADRAPAARVEPAREAKLRATRLGVTGNLRRSADAARRGAMYGRCWGIQFSR